MEGGRKESGKEGLKKVNSSSCTLPFPKVAASATADLIWTKIALGERYVVNAMYDNGAFICSSTLCCSSCESFLRGKGMRCSHTAAAEGIHD